MRASSLGQKTQPATAALPTSQGAHAILGCRIELTVPRTTCLQLRSVGFKVLGV